jgi:hypothetical protein
LKWMWQHSGVEILNQTSKEFTNQVQIYSNKQLYLIWFTFHANSSMLNEWKYSRYYGNRSEQNAIGILTEFIN